mmetsp:Transcript_41570/g.114515  ORF Transcript_41570/g.114515 Transcript_41570/m.114515 type:complete len:247 (-) Transcript_41570:281-1021(-)
MNLCVLRYAKVSLRPHWRGQRRRKSSWLNSITMMFMMSTIQSPSVTSASSEGERPKSTLVSLRLCSFHNSSALRNMSCVSSPISSLHRKRYMSAMNNSAPDVSLDAFRWHCLHLQRAGLSKCVSNLSNRSCAMPRATLRIVESEEVYQISKKMHAPSSPISTNPSHLFATSCLCRHFIPRKTAAFRILRSCLTSCQEPLRSRHRGSRDDVALSSPRVAPGLLPCGSLRNIARLAGRRGTAPSAFRR